MPTRDSRPPLISALRVCGAALLAATLILAASCGRGGGELIVGATTSLQDTGLLDALVEAYEDERGVNVKPVVAGSGQVLELARRGEVDVIVTHSPDAERRLVNDGDGIDRRPVMHNFLLLAGPPDDPANVQSVETVAEALRLIASEGTGFVSRGDNSGTHVRELALWEEAGIDPSGESWYSESGSGQGQNLLVASDKGAYTLVDSATFTTFWGRLELDPFLSDRERNEYSVILVSPQKHGEVNEAGALDFADWLISPAAQRIIADYGVEEYGQPLFEPDNPIYEATPASTP
jgi:tungstate transport system substrate-binding protein